MIALVLSSALAAPAIAADTLAPSVASLPNVQGVAALATVEGEPVSWNAFLHALTSIHAETKQGQKSGKQEPQALLDRLVTGKLIAQESRAIGLDRTPEFKTAVETFRDSTLTAMVLERPARSITTSDPADVTRFYRGAAGLAKFDSLLFERKADAEALVAKVRAGGDFVSEANASVASGRSKSFDQGGGGPLGELQPELASALSELKPGQVSGAIGVKQGWVVAKLLDFTIRDDPSAKAKAEEQALEWKRLQAVKAYTSELRKRHARLDAKLVDGIDFDADKPGLAALKKDTRVVATVAGAKPLTVADLAAEVDRAFFHGTEKAIKEKKLNAKKYSALDELLVARLTVSEGVRLGLDKTPEFRDKQREYEDGLLFNAFLNKVILPDVKIDESEIKAWYEGHKGDDSSPAMLKLESIAFLSRGDAESARAKIMGGADFGWLEKNAAGRAPASEDQLSLNGVYVVDEVDPELAKTLASPKEGDARLYAAPGEPVYMIVIRAVIPANTRAYADVRSEAGQAVINEKTKAVLDTWSVKLRKAYKVTMLVTPVQLDALIRSSFGPKA
jgi:hypothetical protein